jgi:hypothetical protein
MALIHADLDAKSVTIHADTKFILDRAFKGSKAESVIFNDNLISIGSSAFFSCYIKEAVLPESLKRIGYSAFDNCHGLKSITIGGEIEKIGELEEDIKQLHEETELHQRNWGKIVSVNSLTHFNFFGI